MNDYLGIGILLALLYIAHQISKIYYQNQDAQFRLDKLLGHQGFNLGVAEEPSTEVKELAIAAGKEIEAIKAYREQTGLGLKEARAVVQRLRRASASDA
jgi:ribosomal protein L7/L12